MTKHVDAVRLKLGIILVCGALALAACGGREAATPTPRVAPTPMSAQFAMPTSMITPPAGETAAAMTPEPRPEGTDAATGVAVPTATPPVGLGRGERVYLNQGCGKCHGEQGEGVPDKGSAVAGTSLTYPEFEDALRTGNKGELGNEHIFGPQRISPGGVEALHAWLQSLPAE